MKDEEDGKGGVKLFNLLTYDTLYPNQHAVPTTDRPAVSLFARTETNQIFYPYKSHKIAMWS